MTKRKLTKRAAMSRMIRALEAQGWRVRREGWSATWACEARWDFCRGGDSLFPMTPEAGEAGRQLCDGEPISPRQQMEQTS
jgi:hypothetical protein